MKKGSGDDPFADLADEDEPEDSGDEPQGSDADVDGSQDSSEEPSSSTTERYTDSGESSSRAASEDVDAEAADSTGETAQKEAITDDNSGEAMSKAEADGIPWVLRRSRVKEDRENVHQFFLREEYSTREDDIIEAVAGELDMRQKDLQKLDVREAMVAAADPEDIADVLREWGYEYLK
jgi:hypothetical protein